MADELLIADAHNDLLLELVLRRHEPNPFARHWLAPLRAGGVRLQVTPVYTVVELPRETALRRALAQVAAFHRALRENPDETRQITRAADVLPLADDPRIALLLAIEGAEPWETADDLVDDFWELGVRMAGLTWNHRNVFADGVGEPAQGGLSARGSRLVERLCARGVILDLAHASEQTFRDVLEQSGSAPVLASHANCRSVFDSRRNLDDRQLAALAARGGLLGLMALPFVTDPADPSIDRLIDHVDHAVSIMGAEHVALGGDFFVQIAQAELELAPPGTTESGFGGIAGLSGPEHYPVLVAALRRRGYTGSELAGILGTNVVRFLARSIPA